MLLTTSGFFGFCYGIKPIYYGQTIWTLCCLIVWFPGFITKKLIYDSHEYFTGVPELESRPDIQRVWKKLENMLLPKISYMITVNDSIAGLYESEYGKKVIVVRNIPDYTPVAASVNADAFKELVGLPVEKNSDIAGVRY